MAWAAKRPANEPLTGLFIDPLTARFYVYLSLFQNSLLTLSEQSDV